MAASALWLRMLTGAVTTEGGDLSRLLYAQRGERKLLPTCPVPSVTDMPVRKGSRTRALQAVEKPEFFEGDGLQAVRK